MSQKKSKGTVSTVNADGRIRLRWGYQGKRYTLNLLYAKTNLIQARRIALQMESDITRGLFDSTLNSYKPNSLHESSRAMKSLVA
jgi:integrase